MNVHYIFAALKLSRWMGVKNGIGLQKHRTKITYGFLTDFWNSYCRIMQL